MKDYAGFDIGYDFTVSMGQERYYGNIYSGGLNFGFIPVEAHVQITFTNITSSPAGTIIRILLGPLLGNALNWILGFN